MVDPIHEAARLIVRIAAATWQQSTRHQHEAERLDELRSTVGRLVQSMLAR